MANNERSSLVLELQREALNPSVSVSDLLRKALVVTEKLDIAEFQKWIKAELYGYKNIDVPDYRVVAGRIMAWNPYQGWLPVMFDDADLNETLSTRAIADSIVELEDLRDRSHRDGGQSGFQISLPKEMELDIMQKVTQGCVPTYHIDGAQLHGIIQTVKQIVLEWSLKLEKEGILGEGMTFSPKDKQKASKVTYNLNIGTVSGSQIQQGTEESIQQMETKEIDFKEVTKLLQSIKDSIDSLGIDSPEKEELLADLETIQSQASSPKPKTTIIRECWKSIRAILEGATANTLASGFLHQIGSFLG